MAALIAYYSRAGENYFGGAYRRIAVGNTEKAANMLAELTGGELYKIEQEQPYSEGYKTCIAEAKADLQKKARPEVLNLPDDLDAYYTSRDPIKNYFPLPNEVFALGLSPGALAVYSYLMYIEDRTTYQCHASYKTIGNAVNMSPNTVRKYVTELVERGLIQTERTTIITQDGRKQNGSLLYTLLPIQFSIQQFYEQKLAKLDAEREQERIRKRLEAFQQTQQENTRPPA